MKHGHALAIPILESMDIHSLRKRGLIFDGNQFTSFKISTVEVSFTFQTGSNMFQEINTPRVIYPIAKAVEVLLRSRAFVVKRTSDNSESGKGQVTWSKFPSVADAWSEAKRRSGF